VHCVSLSVPALCRQIQVTQCQSLPRTNPLGLRANCFSSRNTEFRIMEALRLSRNHAGGLQVNTSTCSEVPR
jgi:hypothetical protein